MEPFITHTGIVVAMDRANVDTDQIIPKQFLKRIERTGFGEFLFFDWRYHEDGSDNANFELNCPTIKGARKENEVWILGSFDKIHSVTDAMNETKASCVGN